ncbi:hypothetical protein M1L60_42130 [Actinoplanes sp. TRM 88003]|uniref:Uncharacterized protein n=1 Tax=Paractinoplanes aksuensis TaxID=2939490 RepID=A0ABT1E4W9_9ACTN|nr:hypothetical protein [Actinoplanes aksuensis]
MGAGSGFGAGGGSMRVGGGGGAAGCSTRVEGGGGAAGCSTRVGGGGGASAGSGVAVSKVSGSHGVSWSAHGSTAGVVAQCSSSTGGGSVSRRHHDFLGDGSGTTAEPLQRAGASTVEGSEPLSSRVGSGTPAAG